MSLFENIKKRGLKDILRPRKWGIFVRFLRSKWMSEDEKLTQDVFDIFKEKGIDPSTYNIDAKLIKEYSELTTPHELEQIAWRMQFRDCRQCIKSGACVHCGCKSPELFYDRSNECSALNWTGMVDKETWDEWKARSSMFHVDPDYIKQIKIYGEIIKFKD